MRILVLGGTGFVGRAIAEDALRSGVITMGSKRCT
jgi:uncharacterized protein YbjT (DUF2867 family)